jgi:hypothetical protein
MEDLLKYLLKHNRELSEQVVRLSEIIANLTTGTNVVVPDLTFPSVWQGESQVQAGDPRKLYLDEGEEDLDWAIKQGLITQADAEDILKQAKFDNTEIEFNS